MKINFVLIISFLCAVWVVNNVNAQNKFVLKGGPTFGVSTTNYWGAGLGVERQIGRRTAFAATVEYLTSKIPTDAEFLVMVNSNSFWRSNYVPTSIGVNGEFRFYFKNNPLTSLEGFYMGLGIEVGQLTATELRVNFQSGQPYTKLKTPITESLTYGGPNLSLGGVVPIGDNLSLEFSGGLKLNFADRNRGQAFMPITARIRYSF